MSAASNGALVRILLTDAPVDAEKVFAKICGIDVENRALAEKGDAAGTAWHRVATECREVELLGLQNGVTEAMGIGELPAGDYSRIRLMVQDASMVKNGVNEPLALSSEGKASGFMISSQFSIGEGDAATVTVDFDAGESIKESGDGAYELRPALSVASVQIRARVRQGTPDQAQLNDGTSQGDGAGGAMNQGSTLGDGAGGVMNQGSTLGDGAGGVMNQGSTDPALTQEATVGVGGATQGTALMSGLGGVAAQGTIAN